MKIQKQHLPKSGAARELLRSRGQFWTPDWVADAMVAYVLKNDSEEIFDPAVGAGAFFRAAQNLAAEQHRPLRLSGYEVDAAVLEQAKQDALTEIDFANVELKDFVLHPPQKKYRSIVGNPPYIRHHRLPNETKAVLKKYSAHLIGKPIDGRAGLHIWFLLRALELLDKGGRLAFIMPADTCEGIFAATLWRWITEHHNLEAVITFSPGASPFPQVDTNPIIFLLRKEPPAKSFLWAKCNQAESSELKNWIAADFRAEPTTTISIYQRELSEGLTTGLSRMPVESTNAGQTLGDFAKVMRGIATGANEFFFLTGGQARELGLPEELLIRAIGRTRDLTDDEVTAETLKRLEQVGRPTLLFSPDGRPLMEFSLPVREYLEKGERMRLGERPLIATRHPWYKMEKREAPAFLFAYLGRRNTRFIRNLAGVIPLTGFLCVYPHQKDHEYVEKLGKVLQHPQTLANLSLVGKSYGSGAIKVEPRALERLPLPTSVLEAVGLKKGERPEQLSLYQSGD